MATLIRPNGSTINITPKNKIFTIEELQHHVGGYVEEITLPNKKLLIVDKDGKEKKLPTNGRATTMARVAGIAETDYIVGNALICNRQEID